MMHVKPLVHFHSALLARVFIALQSGFSLARPVGTHIAPLIVSPKGMVFSAKVDRLVKVLTLSRAVYSLLLHCGTATSNKFSALGTWARDTFMFKSALFCAIFSLIFSSRNDKKETSATVAFDFHFIPFSSNSARYATIMLIVFIKEIARNGYFFSAVVAICCYLLYFGIVPMDVSSLFFAVSVFVVPVAQKSFSAPAGTIDSFIFLFHSVFHKETPAGWRFCSLGKTRIAFGGHIKQNPPLRFSFA